jgi:hypothetical protein
MIHLARDPGRFLFYAACPLVLSFVYGNDRSGSARRK